MDGPDEVLGAPPVADPLTLAVARAKLEAALFARGEPVKVGRYHLLEQVGAGGMGVVWGAWDPELERRVAIKLVKAESGATRERILVEGQALAKLSHPNVVAVHDVGVVDDRVYLVMEWVRGKTLRAYASEPRTVRELVAVYRAAGEGLAAAHHAGLIHRDFKPDNAVIGDDGRVRVLDFGLARAEGVTERVGTPRYMAPEQTASTPLTAAADQYALCVSLDEALRGRTADNKPAPVPTWLEAIVKRGTAVAPAQRFASMDELVRALGNDPAKRRRRLLAAAGAIGAAGTAFALGSLRSTAATVEPCSGAPAELAAAWNDTRRAHLVAHLGTLGPYGVGEATRLAPQIDAYAERWRRAHHGACMALGRRELTPQLYERNLACLARARVSLQTSVDVLASVPAERVGDAALAFQALPDADRCLVETRTLLLAPPPSAAAADVARVDEQLAVARVRALASDPVATATLASLVGEAERLAYAPLAARAYLDYGLALTRTDRAEAITWLERAAGTALDAGDDGAFVEAYARQIYASATKPQKDRPAELAARLASLHIAERIAGRLPSDLGAFAQVLLANNAGIAYMASGDPKAAATWFERAYARWRASKDPSNELMFVPSNLALVASTGARQQELLAESAAQFTAALGPAHPLSLEFQTRAAMATRNPADSARLLGEACASYQRFHPHLTTKYLPCAYELAWLAAERGDTAAARTTFASLGDGTSPQQRVAQLALAPTPHAARALADELLRAEHWWERVFAADALLLAGERADLERALTALEANAIGRSQVYHQRRLARVHAQLALSTRDHAHADAALAWYREAGGYDAMVTALTTDFH
jgi:hypothetical protein